jgi:hypothetical protein
VRGDLASHPSHERQALEINDALLLVAGMKRFLLATAIFIAAAGSAHSYTAYLRPTEFWPDGARVNVQGAYTTTFFTPEIALGGEFTMIEPDGSNGVFTEIEIGADSTNLASDLYNGGTYRITSGEVLGGVSTLVGVDGSWRALGQGEAPPAGAQTTTLQTVTVTDVYITRGQPTRESVDRTIGRLALRPVTHPNQILVSDGFQVQALFDGQAFANTAIVLYREGEPETALDRFFVTDANGNATITLDEPGSYILAARHRANAPAGAQAAVQSYTTTLVFEALTELPAITEVSPRAEQPTERRRARRTGNRIGTRTR